MSKAIDCIPGGEAMEKSAKGYPVPGHHARRLLADGKACVKLHLRYPLHAKRYLVPTPYEIYIKIIYHLSREARHGDISYRLPQPFDKELPCSACRSRSALLPSGRGFRRRSCTCACLWRAVGLTFTP